MSKLSRNKLAEETSPYLQQHAQNPVEWYPWGEQALTLAREQNKPILLSIGYSACHWCHVMAHESFEDASIAAIMNQHFINIKVDREERPDIDRYLMAYIAAIGGQGGWPLTVFLTPDGKQDFSCKNPKSKWYAGFEVPKPKIPKGCHLESLGVGLQLNATPPFATMLLIKDKPS